MNFLNVWPGGKEEERAAESPQVNPPPCQPPDPPLLVIPPLLHIRIISPQGLSMPRRYTENKRRNWLAQQEEEEEEEEEEKVKKWKKLWKWPVVFSCPLACNQHRQVLLPVLFLPTSEIASTRFTFAISTSTIYDCDGERVKKIKKSTDVCFCWLVSSVTFVTCGYFSGFLVIGTPSAFNR